MLTSVITIFVDNHRNISSQYFDSGNKRALPKRSSLFFHKFFLYNRFTEVKTMNFLLEMSRFTKLFKLVGRAYLNTLLHPNELKINCHL